MKPLREQFIDVLGYKGKTLNHYRDFTLMVVAGFALVFGEMSAMVFHSARSPFDLKVAIGCFAMVGICILLAANRLLVLSTSVMVPGALVWWALRDYKGSASWGVLPDPCSSRDPVADSRNARETPLAALGVRRTL